MRNYLILALFLVVSLTNAQIKSTVGEGDFSDWSGIKQVKSNEATVKCGQLVSYEYSDCNREYLGLMRNTYGDATDWSSYSGLQFEIFVEKDARTSIAIDFKVSEVDYPELNPVSKTTVELSGMGWQKVYVPWEMFDLTVGQRGATLNAVKSLNISAESDNNKTYKLRNVEVVAGEYMALNTPIKGKAAPAGEEVSYDFEVANTTNEAIEVKLVVEKVGWESMTTSLSATTVSLAANETKTCQLTVNVPSKLPQGIREKQVVKALPNGKGGATQTLTFVTAVEVPTPNIVFTADKWDEVRTKIENYQWAKDELAKYEEKASKWKVPAGRDPLFEGERIAVFKKSNSEDIYDCALTYQMTGKEEYATKVLQLFRRLCDEEKGYPATLRGGGDSFVAEGVFFQGVSRGYDLIRDSEQLTAEDHRLIQQTLRIYIDRTIKGNMRGGISNWNVAEITGALYAALCLQDWSAVEHLLHSPTGIYQQMTHGIMSDGWWYECAVGYNLWVASEFSEIAIALRPWGINLVDEKLPLGTTDYFSLQATRRVNGLHGIAFMKWGSLNTESIGIKDMWDAVVPFLDYRGVLPAVNDAKEDLVTGKPYELAYYLYRDPEYAAIINRGTERNLLYGVPELPAATSEKSTQSAFADNLGLVQLRSQTEGRPQSERIQAALHYGSHGGHHGHFDRTSFVSMMRYGRSFYNPEMFWYGYASYLYKFLVQTSINKNMVVVDQKMQEPTESFKTMYYTGDMMQATMVESNARWSHPPYGGMIYSAQHDIDFPEKMWLDGRSIEVPEDRPPYGDCTDFTENIMQRRLMVVMDDYVVLADYLEAAEERTFDWLFQVKGFQGIDADKVKKTSHTGQMSNELRGAAQFITDCDWYETEGTSRTDFEMCWGDDCDNAGARMPHSEEGTLRMGIYNAWPQNNEIMIGTAPESFGVNKQTWFKVIADGQTLVNDSSGIWILGSRDLDVDVSGKKELTLSTKLTRSKNNTLFWGNAKLLLNDGSEVYLSTLPLKYNNVAMPSAVGKDYYNGEVKIAGDLMDKSTPAMPKNIKEEATVTVDISNLDADRLITRIGGDFPMGDESSRRKTMAVRTHGKSTRYLSVIEPYETESFIKSVKATDANHLVVELKDGRVQEIELSDVESEDGKAIVKVKETKKGKVIREETNL